MSAALQTHRVDEIAFTFAYSERRTASLFVERDGTVHLIAPQNLPINQIEDIIREKKRWIFRSLAEWEDLNASRQHREFVSGEGFLYLGRTYRLRVCDSILPALVLKDGYFLIRPESLKHADKAFETFYTHKGKNRFVERVNRFAPKVGVEPQRVRVADLGYRWGSCTPEGNLNFHWKTMMAPLSAIDYIVVHELVHLLHPNHTDAFWNELDKVMPDYERRREWLRRNGAGLSL